MPEFVKTLLWVLGGAVIGAILGWFFTKKAIEKQLKENPPINEKMIRAMYRQMGRPLSETDLKKIMRSMNQ